MNDTTLSNHLLQYEQQILERRAEDFASLLADDFFEFGSSGRTWTKQQVIDELSGSPAVQATIVDFRISWLAPDAVLATFRIVKGEGPGGSLRSSIWRQSQGKWQLIFHQGTPSGMPRT